jgi:hypothetical protein
MSRTLELWISLRPVNRHVIPPPVACVLTRDFTPASFVISPPRPSRKSNDSKGFKNRNARAFLTLNLYI